jgi:putative flippase GtrA
MSALAQASPLRAFLLLLSRFGLAGLINTAVGYAIIAGLDVGLHVDPALANATGYLVGVGIGFVLNRSFVFKSATSPRTAGMRYIAVVIPAFLFNQAVLKLSGVVLGPGALQHMAAQLAGMACYTITVFLACRFWVFRPSVQAV